MPAPILFSCAKHSTTHLEHGCTRQGAAPGLKRAAPHSKHNTRAVSRHDHAVLQIARKSTIGPWPLRPFWRAAYWALTELPARLEDILPTAPTVPLTALKSLPEERSDGGAICASPADAAANRTAHAAGIPVKASTSAAEGACAALGDGFAAS